MVSLNVAIAFAVPIGVLRNLIKYFDRRSCLSQSILQQQMFLKRYGRNSQSLNAVKHRSSRPKVFCEKGVLRNFTKFTRKHLCQSFFFNKVIGLRPFFIEHLWWLILNAIATLCLTGKASRHLVSCFSKLFLNILKLKYP